MCAAMLASCDFKGGSKDLKAENDSLLMELTQRNAELDDMMGTFNEVQEGFRKINAAESRVDLQRGTITENSASAKQQIASDIEFISKQMEENKAQIAKLEAQLKNSKYNSTQMKKAVEALTAELKAKQQRIEELQTELASKNIRIQELDAAVSDLSAAKESLAAENEAKAKTVAEQDKSLNAAWFVFGTKSELKAQKILQSGDVLDLLRSPLPCRRPDRRELRRPQQLEWGGDPPTLPGAAGKNAHPQPGGGAGEVPPPALRRDAPADHDRNCHRHGARTAHCGRAHHRH